MRLRLNTKPIKFYSIFYLSVQNDLNNCDASVLDGRFRKVKMKNQNQEYENITLPARLEVDIFSGRKKVCANGSACIDNIWSSSYGTIREE